MGKIYLNVLLKISGFVWTRLFTIVSIYKYDQNHFGFFKISFIFNSVNLETLICMTSQILWDSKKGRFHDDVILPY